VIAGEKTPVSESEAARQLWQRARQKAESGDCDFSEHVFPVDPDGQGFRGITFKGCADFSGATFEGDASFSAATFKGDTVFRKATFNRVAYFQDATFEGDASFNEATFRLQAVFLPAAFEGDVAFVDAAFERDAIFLGTKFGGYASFSEATFKTDALFVGTTFGGYASFMKATFEGDALCVGTTFGGYASYMKATFEGDADFSGATFEGDADFQCRKADEVVTFDLPNELRLPGQEPRPFRVVDQGESAYRLAKQSAQNNGDYRSAGRYHYAEQCAINWGRRQAVTWKPWKGEFWSRRGFPLLPWLEWLFGRWVFGYGEKPTRPLVLGLSVICFCTLLYAGGGLIQGVEKEDVLVVTDLRHDRVSVISEVATEGMPVVTDIDIPDDSPETDESAEPGSVRSGVERSEMPVVSDVEREDVSVVTGLVQKRLQVATTDGERETPAITHNLGSALYFSVVTFTTLGYGDLHPNGGWMRFVAGCEALSGAALMALFIVSLARKFTR
jgi:uncharacterized protein YjbI with pentapeptide repeats